MDFPKKQAQRLMPLYLLEYNEKLFENHPNPEAPWGGGGSDYTAGYGIDITNSEISVDTDVIATKSDIASMVTTSMLEDALDDYALKTDIPENVSDLNNDAGYTTQTWVENQNYIKNNDQTYAPIFRGQGVYVGTGLNYPVTWYSTDWITRNTGLGGQTYDYMFPAKSGTFAMTSDIPENVSDLNNDAGYTTQTWVENQGYITGINSSDVIAALGYTPGTSNFSGSYNDLTDTPTIGHGVLTIQVNGVNVKQFSANETAAKTANIIVPTATSDLTNDSGFITGITSNDVTTALGYTPGTSNFSGNYNDLTNKPTIPDAVSGTNDGTNWTSLTIGNSTYDIPQGGGSTSTHAVLYTDRTETVAGKDVVLSDSADNYDYLDIVMSTSNDSFRTSFTTDRIYKDSGTSTTFVGKCFTNKIMGEWDGGTGSAYNKIGYYTFTSNTNIQVSGCGKTGTYRQMRWISKNGSTPPSRETNGADGQKWVKITKVIGYKW